MAKLVVLSEGFTGLTHEIKTDKVTIGRMEDNNFQIAEQSISSHHIEFLKRGSDYVVKDLNSTNGTFISGEQVSEKVIKPGQILRLGQVEIRFETGEGAATVPSTGKKVMDKTMVIPQGVKADELDRSGRPVDFNASKAFSKKSNKTAKIFIIIGVVLGVIILGLVIVAFMKM